MAIIPPILRSPLRGLLQAPGFAVLCILTLGIGMCASVVIFSIVHGVLLRPLPIPEPERVVAIWHTSPGIGSEKVAFSDKAFLYYRRASRSLEELAIYLNDAANRTDGPEPERLTICMATASLFSVLGVPPSLGRTLVGGDERLGAEPVAVISDELWRRAFGKDTTIVGRILRLDGVARRIVGVMPSSFSFPHSETSVWIPITIDPADLAPQNFSYRAIGRLRPGISSEEAAREMSNLSLRLPDEVGEPFTRARLATWKLGVLVHNLRDEMVGGVATTLWTLLGAAGLILIIACANVSNLILVRAEGRRREVAVRVALGASRAKVANLFLAESALLAIGGGAVALVVAVVAVRFLLRLQPPGIPRLEEVGIDGSVFVFTFVIALVTGFTSGGLVVIRATAPELAPALKEGGRSDTASKGTHRVRWTLAAVQVALALVVLIATGLLGKSFWRLQSVNPGFDPRRVLTVLLTLPRTEYPNAQTIARFVREVREKVETLPGVRSAAIVSLLPLAGHSSTSSYAIEDRPVPDEGARVSLGNQFVSPGYFETMRIPVLAGTTFVQIDPDRRQGEVVISRSVAERFWPGESPLGKRLTPESAREGEWYRIIGVVEDVREAGLDKQPTQVVYFGWRRLADTETGEEHWVPAGGTLVVRTDLEPSNLATSVRNAVHAVDPGLPVPQIRTMEEVVHRSMDRSSFMLLNLGVTAAVALLLGAVGIYAIVAHIVSQRTREIGVRMALGAHRSDIARLVLRDGFILAFLGVTVGLITASVLTRFMRSLLFEVSPTDPVIFSVISVFLGLVTLCASWLPAQRAMQVEPLEAIRSE